MVDLKTVTGLAKAFGPTKEHQRQFGRSFVGTLLGQATAFLLMLLVYIAALVLLNKFAIDELKSLKVAIGPDWFWALAVAPFICIILFSLTPTLWRASRERRLKRRIFAGELQFNPGYFRLYPYSGSDSERFHRLDGAGDKIRNWIQSGSGSLLYLSGASGVGKSSLLAADVIPKLRADGWTIVKARLFSEPLDQLQTALLHEPGLFARKPAPEIPLRTLLERLAEARKRRGDAPLLIVIDQFEEFLVLHSKGGRAPLLQFLGGIVEAPIDGIRLLLVFRSDYRPLVFKLQLPPLLSGENWQELGPYDRGEATAFIQGGGRHLSIEALNELFRGLDRIDGTPGLYRPITLNMVGLVLERMGSALEGDPAQLVQRYLSDALVGSEARDFAKSLLTRMITDAGTKEPRSEIDLASDTHFQLWQVQASLADLADRGIVRRLEGVAPFWEISHDFVARILGQLIGRIRPNRLVRMRPFIAPIALCGWLIFTVGALVYGGGSPDPAHIEITPMAKPADTHDGRIGVNLSIVNDGGYAAINFRRVGKPLILVEKRLSKEELEPFFKEMVVQLDSVSEGGDIYPKKSLLLFALF